MTRTDVLAITALVSGVGGLFVLAGVALFLINGGVIERARRRRVRRVAPPVVSASSYAAALAEVARLNRLLSRERLCRIRVAGERDRWMSLAGDLWSQLDGVDGDQRTPVMEMYIGEYERMAGVR